MKLPAYPVFVYVTLLSQLLPVVASAGYWGRRPPTRFFRLSGWCMLLVLSDVVDAAVAMAQGDNTRVWHFSLPVEAGVSLWVLAGFQPTPLLRRWYTLATTAPGVLIGLLSPLSDFEAAFELWISPLVCFLLFVAALHTLVYGSLRSRSPLPRQDWFWVSLGMALFWAGFIPMEAFSLAFIDSHREWVLRALNVRYGTVILAFLMMAGGVACPRMPARSSTRS